MCVGVGGGFAASSHVQNKAGSATTCKQLPGVGDRPDERCLLSLYITPRGRSGDALDERMPVLAPAAPPLSFFAQIESPAWRAREDIFSFPAVIVPVKD